MCNNKLLTVIIFLNLFLAGCSAKDEETEKEDKLIEFQKEMDARASSLIDSAYAAITKQCDSARTYRLPLLIDSLLKAPKDSSGL